MCALSSSLSNLQYGLCLVVLFFLVQNINAAPPSLLSSNVSTPMPEELMLKSKVNSRVEELMEYLEYQSINKSCIYPPRDLFVSQPNHHIVYKQMTEFCSLPKNGEKLSHSHEKYKFLCNEMKTITVKLCKLGGKVSEPIESTDTIMAASSRKDPKEFCTTFQKNYKGFQLNNRELPGVIEDESKQSFDEFFNLSTINVNEDMKNEHHHQCKNICFHEIENSTDTLINSLCALVFKGYEIYNTLSDDFTQVAEKSKGQPENADLNSSGEVQDNVIPKDENPLQIPIKSKKNTLHTESIPSNDEKKAQQNSTLNIIQSSSTISQTSGTNTSANNNTNNIIDPSKAKNEEENNLKGEDIGNNKNVNQNPKNQQDSKISSSTAKSISSKEPNNIVNPDEYNPENELEEDVGGDITNTLDNPAPANNDKESLTDRKKPDQSETFDQQHVSASSGDKYYMIVKNPKDRTTIEFAINPESDTNFFSYFVTMIGILLIAYVAFHNKKRIIAYVIEGRRPQREVRTRRTSTTSYRKLENNYD